MIKLYGFGSKFGVTDPSPFVLKINTYMRMAKIDFESVNLFSNLRKSPKGKLPFIIDGDKRVADSQFIIQHFKEKYGDTLDTHLSSEQQALVYLITKSLDENFYFTLVYSRWLQNDTWPLVNKAFFGKLPFILRTLVPAIARKSVANSLKGQGITNHSCDEIKQICRNTLQSLSDLLGDKDYFFGDKPSSLDATAYAFLAEFILVNFDNPFNQIAREYTVLVNYCQRIQQEYYP